jgi:hypothetical protein
MRVVYVDAVWVFIAGAIYFRGVETYERDFNRYIRFRAEPGTLPPLSLREPRILIQALLLSVPFGLWTKWHYTIGYKVLTYFAIGPFFETFLIPSGAEPQPSEVRDWSTFCAKWSVAKLDTVVKTFAVGIIIWGLLHLGAIARPLSWLVNAAFPVTSDAGGEALHDLLQNQTSMAALAIALVCFVTRALGLPVYGRFRVLLPFILSFSFLWIEFQYLFDKSITLYPSPWSSSVWIIGLAAGILFDLIAASLRAVIYLSVSKGS